MPHVTEARFTLGAHPPRCQNAGMRFPGCVVFLALLLASCHRPAPSGYQGYLEGEFVYVAAPLGGRLEKLAVAKGARVAAGAALFTLERGSEIAAQRQAGD